MSTFISFNNLFQPTYLNQPISTNHTLTSQAGEEISDEEAIEAARQAQILDTLTALPERLETFLGTGGVGGWGWMMGPQWLVGSSYPKWLITRVTGS